MTETIELWIEAAKVLAVNPTAIVSCPKCQVGKVIAKDQPFEDQIDHFLYCETCGHAVLMVPNSET